MRFGYAVEQVFVRPRGGGLELFVVLVALSGAIKHETLRFLTTNAREAVTRAARQLAARGDIESAEGVRLRVEVRGALRDDAALRRLFVQTFESSQ
ncbi:MAG: hypothetical protein KGZ60_09735 [Truepera sp.]|nr:hypothetical protein [Truepera sp.]MBS3967519.1 hypothetical protein [Truepera sp.]